MLPTLHSVGIQRSKVKELLKFLRENLFLVLLWPAVALIIGTCSWLYLLSSMDDKAHQAEHEIFSKLTAYASNYADRSKRSLDSFDLLLRVMRRNWHLSQGRINLVDAAEQSMLSSGSVAAIAVFDGDGRMLTSSRQEMPSILAAGKPYFAAHLNAGGAALHFSANIINAILGKHGLLGLLGADEAFQITRTGNIVYAPPSLLLTDFPRRQASGTAFATGEQWFADKRNRNVAWQPVKAYPLTAMVGLDGSEAMAGYWSERSQAITDALWNTLWLAIAAMLAMAFSVLVAWRRYQLALIRAAYRIATEDSGDGFFIDRPIQNQQEKKTDFEIVDCNHRGAELVGMRRDELVGRKASELYD